MSELINQIETLTMWADGQIENMECRQDEDCDHCLGLSIVSEARLAAISALATIDPMPDTKEGAMLRRMSDRQEAYEKWAFPDLCDKSEGGGA